MALSPQAHVLVLRSRKPGVVDTVDLESARRTARITTVVDRYIAEVQNFGQWCGGPEHLTSKL